jgi:kinetochore protein Mis13/DSN1
MTTLVQTRQPLQLLSMSIQPKRRRSERIAGRSHRSSIPSRELRVQPRRDAKGQGHTAISGKLTRTEHLAYDEQDGDFVFARKRVKTAQPEPIPEDELAPAPAPASKPAPKSTSRRGRPPKQKELREEAPKPAPKPAPKRTSKGRSSQTPIHSDDAPSRPPPPQQRTMRHRTRSSIEKADSAVENPANGASKARHFPEEHHVAAQSTPMDIDKVQRADDISAGKKIALPFSDTPIINRNKEMRKKTGNRRSSVGMRGRRASSLIESGHSAIPHREVSASEFYKHIEADGLSEPRRMKQLLTWCGERSLVEKPPLGSLNSNAILGGKDILSRIHPSYLRCLSS